MANAKLRIAKPVARNFTMEQHDALMFAASELNDLAVALDGLFDEAMGGGQEELVSKGPLLRAAMHRMRELSGGILDLDEARGEAGARTKAALRRIYIYG